MKRILVHNEMGSCMFAWDASDKALMEAAFLELFKFFDISSCYEGPLDLTEHQLVTQARHGNRSAARALLLLRNGVVDGESFELVTLRDNPAAAESTRPITKVPMPAVDSHHPDEDPSSS